MPPFSSFTRHGPETPASPVVLSVPHAGRAYWPGLLATARVPQAGLQALEDRHVDTLALAARHCETAIVATRPRAWIDLNRGEEERDPLLDDGARSGRGAGAPLSPRLRSGLGLVPRRVGSHGNLWHDRLSDAQVRARIETDHRPYHAAVSAMLEAAYDRFGIAVLLDIHSMPPLGRTPATPRIVFGDRFGKSASGRFMGRLEGVARAFGVPFATNSPYAGGHILNRHGAPRRNIHAIQIEFDRTLYLDDMLDAPGAGYPATVLLLRNLIGAVADEAMPGAVAAE